MSHSIKTLSLHNFRNYRHLYLEIEVGRPTFFVGRNGAGKTNVLEAISIFESSSGMRKARGEELQSRFSPHPWAASLVFDDGTQLSSGLDASGRRVSKKDGKDSRFSDFSNHIWITWITPRLDLVLSESNSEQRKFFDHLVAGIFPDHKTLLGKYKQLLKERGKILYHSNDDVWLLKIEEQLGLLAVAIHQNRFGFINLVKPGMVCLSLEGEFEMRPELGVFIDTMKRNRMSDRSALSPIFGPHKTRWRITYLRKGIEAGLCSTGEQKIMLFDIIRAGVEVYRRINDTCCVLLLDEVFAHLDRQKLGEIAILIESLDTQCFFTCVDAELTDVFRAPSVIKVEDGMCYRM